MPSLQRLQINWNTPLKKAVFIYTVPVYTSRNNVLDFSDSARHVNSTQNHARRDRAHSKRTWDVPSLILSIVSLSTDVLGAAALLCVVLRAAPGRQRAF